MSKIQQPVTVNTDLLAALKAEAQHLSVVPAEDDRPKAQGFPLHVLPEGLQFIVTDLHNTLGYPVDYTASAALFTLSVAVGTSVRVQVKGKWTERATLWLALVGRPGANKSHPLDWMLGPLDDRDGKHAQQYIAAMRGHEHDKQAARETGAEVPPEPQCEQHLVSDATPEALVEALTRNPRGLGLYRDELAGWVADFGRYNKGGDVQMFLSIWSGKALRVNRKSNKHPLFVRRPFVSVCGTIQPGVLGTLIEEGRGSNGFIDRILFAYPETQEAAAWSENECQTRLTEYWHGVVDRVVNIPPPDPDADPLTLALSPDAKRLWVAHHDRLQATINAFNSDGDEAKAQHRTKMLSYTVRLALIHTVATWAESNTFDMPTQVEARSMTAAITLADYFTSTADKVLFTLHESTPVDQLNGNLLTLFDALPNDFRTAEAVVKAEALGLSERTAKRTLNKWAKDGLVKREGQGRYSKRFEH